MSDYYCSQSGHHFLCFPALRTFPIAFALWFYLTVFSKIPQCDHRVEIVGLQNPQPEYVRNYTVHLLQESPEKVCRKSQG
jgi:hypothetical protein